MIVHEDDRRMLFDFEGSSVKAVLVKDETRFIGNHSHLDKDEHFLLIRGRFTFWQVGAEIKHNIEAPHSFDVKKGEYHAFMCEEGSVLLCGSDKQYDEKDEIK